MSWCWDAQVPFMDTSLPGTHPPRQVSGGILGEGIWTIAIVHNLHTTALTKLFSRQSGAESQSARPGGTRSACLRSNAGSCAVSAITVGRRSPPLIVHALLGSRAHSPAQGRLARQPHRWLRLPHR